MELQHLEYFVAVAAGAGMGLVPGSVAQRFAAPGVRFVPLGDQRSTFVTAAVTRRNADQDRLSDRSGSEGL
jgi:DNA-binding transcriptional LysR family regulator